jgi:hypothetical protein
VSRPGQRSKGGRSAVSRARRWLGVGLLSLAGCECGTARQPAPSAGASLPEPAPLAAGGASASPAASSSGAGGQARTDAAPPEVPATHNPSSEARIVASSVGGSDATLPAGGVVRGLVFDTLVEVAAAGPATATEQGVVLVNRANQLWLAPIGRAAHAGSKPHATPLRPLPESAGPFPLSKAPAVRGDYAYWVSRGRLLRGSLQGAGSGAVAEVLREDGRVGTRVAVPIGAAKDLSALPALAAYVARAPTPDAPLTAKLWVEGQPDAPALSDEVSSTHSVTLLATGQGLIAFFLDARTGMSSLHLRRVQLGKGNEVSIGEDRIVWVGGPSRSSTEFLAQSADASSALGLMALERDITHFGLLTLRVPLADAAPAIEPDWLLYENGIEPAPFAGVELCGRRRVALVRPSSAEPHAPQELVLLDLGRMDAPGIVLARSQAFFAVSLSALGQGALLSYVSDQRSWARSLRCAPG